MFQTNLIIGSTPEIRRDEAIKLRNTRGGKPVDTIEIPHDGDSSIKIEDVRQVQQAFSLPPLIATVKTVIFHEMERASAETQHALLKLLEEPPSFGLIILTAAKKESLLPTILSRASTLKLTQASEPFHYQKAYEELHILLGSDTNLKFALGTNFETKEQAVSWLQTTITTLHHKLLADNSNQKPTNRSYIQCIRKATRALNTLQTTNTNPRLLMENLLLDLNVSPIT